jgi:hypothetical protein
VDVLRRPRRRAARADGAARDGKRNTYGDYAFRDRRIRSSAGEGERCFGSERGCTGECGLARERKRGGCACTSCACRACA